MRTYIIPCKLNRDVADSLNLESGRIYTQVFVSHWRAFRKKNVWLSQYGAMGLNDYYNPEKALHAYTIDAAQEGFYKAIKTARAVRKIDPSAKFPHRTKRFRTTIWKQTGIKRDGGTLTLSNGRSNELMAGATRRLPSPCPTVLPMFCACWKCASSSTRSPTATTGILWPKMASNPSPRQARTLSALILARFTLPW